jgi:hypothetical protein
MSAFWGAPVRLSLIYLALADARGSVLQVDQSNASSGEQARSGARRSFRSDLGTAFSPGPGPGMSRRARLFLLPALDSGRYACDDAVFRE